MKACSNFLSIVLAFVLVFSSVSAMAAITDSPTPENSKLNWATRVGEGWQKSAGVPIVVEDDIFITSGDELLVIDSESGEITNKTQMTTAHSYGYAAPAYANGTIYLSLSDGTVQAFDANTLNSKWIYTNESGGKGMTSVTYSDGVVFTGFWNGENKDADFVAIDCTTGKAKWSKTVNGGFYWAGAYCTDNAVIFATDDGSDKIAHIFSCDKETGEVLSCINVENKGDIRSSAAYYNGKIYLTTKGGYLISATLTENCELIDPAYGEIGAASTSTPQIFNDRIYIGTADKSISVFDALTLEKIFSVPVKGYPQCTPLLSTAYLEESGFIYLYTTYNTLPGGVTLIKIKPDAKTADECVINELYDAEGYSQYCISDIAIDKKGTLYYKNDSGYLFSLKDNKTSVNASFAEDGFILPRTKLRVDPNIAESLGYTDTVEDAASALDVLVEIHKSLFGADFNDETADLYLSVSAEGYISRVIGIDTYNFGFAINGKAPHDTILTEYGYTGYSVNQASVCEDDTVEFFIYRDSWAMDNYVHFEADNMDTDYIISNTDSEIQITLEGYSFGWYSCSEDEQIENAMVKIADADIVVLDPETGNISQTIATTDSNGQATLKFDLPGKYILSAKEMLGNTPIISPWIVVDVRGIKVFFDNETVSVILNTDKIDEATIFIAKYTNENILTDVIPEKAKLSDNYYAKNIDINNFGDNIRVFVWDSNLTPLAEVK